MQKAQTKKLPPTLQSVQYSHCMYNFMACQMSYFGEGKQGYVEVYVRATSRQQQLLWQDTLNFFLCLEASRATL